MALKTLGIVLLCWAGLGLPCLAKTTTKSRKSIEYRAYSEGGAFPSIYRNDFAETLRKYPRGRFARAYRGEGASLHRYFVRAATVVEEDEGTRAMSLVLLKLLFGCGDLRYSRALRTEDYATRLAVGQLLDPLLIRYKLSYPLTTNSYKFRQRPRPRPVTPRD